MSYQARRRIRESLPVQTALDLGWKPLARNKSARKYFAFEGPGKFEVALTPRDDIAFTVGNQTSTYVPTVVAWLRELAVKAK